MRNLLAVACLLAACAFLSGCGSTETYRCEGEWQDHPVKIAITIWKYPTWPMWLPWRRDVPPNGGEVLLEEVVIKDEPQAIGPGYPHLYPGLELGYADVQSVYYIWSTPLHDRSRRREDQKGAFYKLTGYLEPKIGQEGTFKGDCVPIETK